MIQVAAHARPATEFDLSALAKQLVQPWADAYETWTAGVSGLIQTTGAKRDLGRRCAPDPCTCRCCVADSDLVVEARLGERRIVPLIIENHWRRERVIELDLSSWTKTASGIAVQAEILSPVTFTLAPCDHAEVILGLQIDGAPDPTPAPSAAGAVTDQKRRALADVEDCAVSYADLRIMGCDTRSIRIAVAVLPRDCGAYRVDCACGCC